MALSALDDKAKRPRDAQVAAVLGRSFDRWQDLRGYLAAECAPLTEEWNYAGLKYGWSLRAKFKKRTIVYLIPQQKQFLAAFVLGGKAVAAAHEHELGLPASALAIIDTARKYAEGTGFRLPVRTKADERVAEILVRIKMDH